MRFREGKERASLVASGVPTARVRQILVSVLALECFAGLQPQFLRVDVYRSDQWQYSNDCGLAVAIALIASMTQRPVPPSLLLVGDIDLHGRAQNMSPQSIDSLNKAIANFTIESPVTVVLAADSAVWVNASSTVRVVPAITLADAVEATWPGQEIRF